MKPTGKILKDFGNVFSPNDPEVVEKTLTRLDEQDLWNDLFSTKLIEVLDTLDEIKAASHFTLRAVEAESNGQARRTLFAARIAVYGCCASWVVTVWAMWLALRFVPVLVPAVVSITLILSVWLLTRRVTSAA